jgi:hypothetical protein
MTVQAFERTHDTPYPPREARVASRARWDAFARRLREHLRLSLGLTPSLPDPPLRALRAEAYRGDGYRIERFALETLPGFYLTGSLFVPDAPADTRAPAMLQPHGHFEQGRLNEADVLRAVALAQAGVYVLSYDMVGYNDQFQLPHWSAEPLEWRRWGFSRAGLQTWNSLCAFEWLRQQRAIDPQRIGCSGISGGGTQTFLLSALEPRLSCAAPVKMVSSVMQGGCICENAPLLRLLAGNPEIAGLTAPRPMLLISDAGDWTRDNPDVVAPYLKRVYGLFRAEEQFAHAHFSEGHQWGAEPRRAYYEWIARVWRLPRTPQDPDLRWESLLPALRVWGDALPKPSDAPTGDAVLRLYQRLAGESVARWRRTRRFEAEARAALLSMLGLERAEDARDDPVPDAWQGVLPSRRYARLAGRDGRGERAPLATRRLCSAAPARTAAPRAQDRLRLPRDLQPDARHGAGAHAAGRADAPQAACDAPRRRCTRRVGDPERDRVRPRASPAGRAQPRRTRTIRPALL